MRSRACARARMRTRSSRLAYTAADAVCRLHAENPVLEDARHHAQQATHKDELELVFLEDGVQHTLEVLAGERLHLARQPLLGTHRLFCVA
eukprot:1674765-Prymnesium_polylepis.1